MPNKGITIRINDDVHCNLDKFRKVIPSSNGLIKRPPTYSDIINMLIRSHNELKEYKKHFILDTKFDGD